MKVEKNLLMAFIKKVRINKRVESCLLNFGEEALTARTMDKGKYVFAKVSMAKDNIDGYEPIGEVCIKNLELLENMVKTFTGTVVFKVEKNMLILKNKIKTKSVVTTLASKDLLELAKDVQPPYKSKPFQLEAKFLLKSVNDIATIFGRADDNLTKSEVTLMSKGDGKIHIIAKDSRNNRVRNTDDLQTGEFKVFFSDAIFKDVVSCLTAKTIDAIAEGNLPLRLTEGGKIKATYHLAQKLSDESE